MQYQDIAPAAPVTRDDLAQIIALQQLAEQTQGTSGQQAGDMSGLSVAAAMDALTGGVPGYESGAPGTGFGVGRGGGEQAGGAMTTSNASMVGEDSLGGGQAVGVPGFGRSGDNTSQASQTQQATDRAALAESAMGRAPQSNTDMFEAASQAFGSNFGRSFEGLSAPAGVPGAPGAPGLPAGQFAGWDQTSAGRGNILGGMNNSLFAPGAFAPAATAVPSFSRGMPLGEEDLNDMDRAALAQPAPGRTVPGGRAPLATATPAPATPGVADPGAGSTGGGGFSEGATGGFVSGSASTEGFGAGYSGSGSMGNTQGAFGFTAGDPSGQGGFAGAGSAAGGVGTGGGEGGGAVGGFGGGTGEGVGASSGADPGGGVG